jgi:hypothetical protein
MPGMAGPVAFYVQIPSVDLRILNQNTGTDITSGVIPDGDYGNFRIDTNLVVITSRSGYNPATDGVFTLKVIDPVGATYVYLVGANGVQYSLTSLNENSSPWYWVPQGAMDGWNTGAQTEGTHLYPFGTYRVTVQYNVNYLQDNDQGVMGIPAAPQESVALESSGTLVLTGPSSSVIRGDRFVTTINGAPDTQYYLWVEGTSSMTGGTGNQPPLVFAGQAGVSQDPVGGPYTIGSYQYSGGDGLTVRDDVPSNPLDGTGYYALVTTDSDGTRPVEWVTSDATAVRSYDIHVESKAPATVITDEVTVPITQGTISIGTTPRPIWEKRSMFPVPTPQAIPPISSLPAPIFLPREDVWTAHLLR